MHVIGKRKKMISIIIPAYDRADLLKLTLESIFKQEKIHYEVIVIDDNSNTDEIFNICKNFKVRYYKNENNSGAQVSRNKGVELSEFDYIAFLDSDDLWDNTNKLFEQYKILKSNNNISVVFTSLKYIDINGNNIKKDTQNLSNYDLNNKFPQIILKKDIIGTYSSVMIRKKDFIKCGKCNVNLPARQDWDLWIRLSKIGNAYLLSDIYTLYRIHDNQISSGIKRKLDGFSQLLLNHKNYFFNKNSRITFYFHLFKLILLERLSKIESAYFLSTYNDNKFVSIIFTYLINIFISFSFTRNLLIKKLSTTYLFKGLFK